MAYYQQIQFHLVICKKVSLNPLLIFAMFSVQFWVISLSENQYYSRLKVT